MLKRITAYSIAFTLLLWCSIASALETEMLVNSGDPANRIDIAILGDGYRAEDQTQLTNDATGVVNRFFAQPMNAAYRAYFNVKLVHVISNETGADGGAFGAMRDTALGAFLNCNGTPRLLCVNQAATFAVAAADAPEFDVILVLVNETVYGGAGGAQILTSTIATVPSAIDIPVHEMGHTFINLADEYEDPLVFAPCSPFVDCAEPNVTLFSDRNTFKWIQWVDAATPIPTPENDPAFTNVVGAFEGARYLLTGIFRPVFAQCIMRVLGRNFCPVCREAGTLEIYSRVSAIDNAIPSATSVIGQGETINFTILGPRPNPNTLSFRWSIDGTFRTQNTTGVLPLSSTDFGTGTHTLSVSIHDDTTDVRVDTQNLLSDTFQWSVTTVDTATGGFPTRDGNDGKFVTVTGQPFATVQNQNTKFLIGVPQGQTTFNVQIFDGDQAAGSVYDTNEIENPAPATARTCYDLYSSVNKATPDTTAPTVRVDSSMLADAGWSIVHNGNVFGQASGSGDHFYILDVYLTNGACGQPFVPVAAGITNTFKVRATGQVSTIANDFAFSSRDLTGAFAVGPLADTPQNDTTFDGQYRYFIDVGSASQNMILRDADADISVDDDPAVVGQRGAGDVQSNGVATGASADIQYRVFNPSTTEVLHNQNPSGNNDGLTVFDTEELSVSAVGTPGTWEWRWDGVHVQNNVRLWAPFGSPVKFELFGEPATRMSPSGAQPRSFWITAPLRGLLPIRLGDGHRCDVKVRSPRDAIAILRGTDPRFGGASHHKAAVCHRPRHGKRGSRVEHLTVDRHALPAHLAHGDEIADLRMLADLAGELLATKLNVADGTRRREDLLAGYVYSRTSSIPEVILAADDALVTGDRACQLDSDDRAEIEALLVLLRAINAAEITYSVPDPESLSVPAAASGARPPPPGASAPSSM